MANEVGLSRRMLHDVMSGGQKAAAGLAVAGGRGDKMESQTVGDFAALYGDT